jgi:hypothetical protein
MKRRQIPINHPALSSLVHLLQSGLDLLRALKADTAIWPRPAQVIRLLDNVEDGLVEGSARLVTISPNAPLTVKDFEGIRDSLMSGHNDMERVHRMLHDLPVEAAMEHDQTTLKIEALVSCYSTVASLLHHIFECMASVSGMTEEEKEKSLQKHKHSTQQGPMLFGGNLEDFLRHLRGEDVD